MTENNKSMNVLVLDMQPIDPPVGGGRLRLLGLYHDLGFPTTYVGTYDWPGEKFRDHRLSSSLREINIPLSIKHFEAVSKIQSQVNGKTIIDTTFHQLAHLSPDFISGAKKEIDLADVVIVSHPWVFPLVRDKINSNKQLLIYDSHNVEGYLRYTLLEDTAAGREIVREVIRIEFELCHAADLILACSAEDRRLFNSLYSIPFEKVKVVPNGVFTSKNTPIVKEEKKSIRKKLGITGDTVAIFIGSNYQPNIEAAQYIIQDLAPKLPEVVFVIAGGVGDGINKDDIEELPNVVLTGFLSDDDKVRYLNASVIAVNPMFSGSGTNIKMFDFMAAGLPIITTNLGARGITDTDYAGIVLVDESTIVAKTREVVRTDERIQNLGAANRKLAETEYSWEKISPQLGLLLINLLRFKNNSINLKSTLKENNKLALLTPWRTRCGIAEYSRHLVNAFESLNVDVSIIANNNPDLQCSYIVDDLLRNVNELWNYDYKDWKDSFVDVGGVVNYLIKHSIGQLNIQYHPGFYKQSILLDLVKACRIENINVSVSLHNTKQMSEETLMELSSLEAKLVVFTQHDEKRIIIAGSKKIFYIPLGIIQLPDQDVDIARRSLRILQAPVIGSFGFLREHKGILELIEAISKLKETFPRILLLGLNSLYPSRDSEEYLLKCRTKINDLKLNDNILLITDFLDTNTIIKYLHATDIIALPYHESQEGASATAGIGIASKRPLIISKSSIFDEIRDVGYSVENVEPAVLADAIRHVMTHPVLLGQLKSKTIDYAAQNSWAKIADKYLAVFT